MDVSWHHMRELASREAILDNTSIEEQLGFIAHQVKNPFDSGDSNYFKKIKKAVTNRDQMNDICEKVLQMITDEYPDLEFDYDNEKDLVDFTDTVYKFFVKNVRKIVFTFLREYIYNNKNRKGLLSEFQDTKIPSYPKEVYGKKEYYLLIVKLPAIVRTISEHEIRLEKFIQYINRDDDAPMTVRLIQDYLDNGMILDHGVYENIMKHFMDCDDYNVIINKLAIRIQNAIIDPYLKETGMESVRSSIVEVDDDEIDDDNDDLDDYDGNEAYDNEQY